MTKCPKCGKNEYGPGPNFDNLRWIGCYACGYGFKSDMNDKPKLFVVTRTPKGLDNILSVKPDIAAGYYCAVVNVSDSPCATFDYQRAGVPSFWFPINEISTWGHAPFYGTLRVLKEYYKGDKPVLIHCHAGANRSPSVAFAILLALGYTVQEAELSINYPDFGESFQRNIERKHIPANIVDFLKTAEASPELTSINMLLRKMDSLYDEWASRKYDEHNDFTIKSGENANSRLVYNKETKRFVLVKNEPKVTPFVDPQFKSQEWYVTPTVPTPEK